MTAPAATVRLNDGQRAALDLGRDLLVSAGAGAGKTQVLGLRILAALETGRARVPEILAFTFTEKAAAEMRQRVQRLLLERIEELRDTRGPARDNLHRARAEFAQCRISTVHGFCHRLLAEYAWEADLEPHAPILEPRDQQATRAEAIRRVLLQTAETDPLAGALERLSANARLNALTGTLDRALRERHEFGRALSVAAKAWADPDAEVARRRKLWDEWQAERLKPVLDAIAGFDRAAVQKAGGRDKLAEPMLAVMDIARRPGVGLPDFGLMLRADGGPRSYGNAGAKANWPAGTLEPAREAMSAAASALGQASAELGRYTFDEAHERRCGHALVDLHALFEAACTAYAEECGGQLDFVELELRAIALLRDNAEAARELCARTKLILVDEYQDTNPTQAELFRLLIQADSTPGRFFAVGDSKQAIYGFRGSDVGIFNNAERAMEQRNARLANSPQKLPWGLKTPDVARHRKGLIGLDTNYRSDKPLLQAGNEIFARVFARDPMRPFDARPQAMQAGVKDSAKGPLVHLHLIAAKSHNQDDNSKRITEAEFVAQRAAELIAQGVSESDIAILMRRGTRNDDYRAAFANAGIPLLLVGDFGLLNTQEGLDCVNLLRLCANPGDDLAALGVLRSPFGGLNDRELTQLALEHKGPLLDRVRAWPGLGQCPAARRFLAVFDQLRAMAGRVHASLLLTHALSELGYALAVGCGSEAEQRLANLGRLIEVTRELQRQYPVLASLARELSARADGPDDEPQALPEQSAKGVRLMTVHRSKGLEFPVVIVPDLGARPGGGDWGMVRDLPSPPDAPLGLWLRALDDEHRGDFTPDFAAWQASLQAAEQAEAEEKRVLYVAWTRAAKRLLLVGTMHSEVKGETWAAQILRAAGVGAFGETAPNLPKGMTLDWHQQTEGTVPKPRTRQIAALNKALQTGKLALPEAVDDSLVAPLPQPETTGRAFAPEAAEFGSMVHAGIEHSLRTGNAEAGFADATVRNHVASALEALHRLPKALAEKPEFSFVTPQGVRRVDLLRVLPGDRFQIVDFKSDELPEAGLAEVIRQRHGEQLREYAGALREYITSRGKPCAGIELYVCLSAGTLAPDQRLVEIKP